MLEKSDALEDAGRSILLELLKYSTIRRIVNMYDNAEFKRLDRIFPQNNNLSIQITK